MHLTIVAGWIVLCCGVAYILMHVCVMYACTGMELLEQEWHPSRMGYADIPVRLRCRPSLSLARTCAGMAYAHAFRPFASNQVFLLESRSFWRLDHSWRLEANIVSRISGSSCARMSHYVHE